jgi:hypothetical protein
VERYCVGGVYTSQNTRGMHSTEVRVQDPTGQARTCTAGSILLMRLLIRNTEGTERYGKN